MKFVRTTCLLLILSVASLVWTVQSVQAHPHVYVDAALTFTINDTGLVSLHENWLFDEIFSNAIMSDLELTPQTLATTLGQAKIRDGAFAYLANYGYFTFLESGGKRLPVTRTEGFKAAIKEGRLVYDFTVPIHLPFDQIHDFRAAIFDKEYYSDILLLKDAISFEIDGVAQVSHVVRPAKDQTYWQFIVPEAVHLSISNTPDNSAPPLVEMTEVETLGPIEQLMNMVRNVQKQLTIKLNGFGMDIKADPFGSALWLFLAFSFLYGIVHAVGPGHGKTVVCSYFLSHPGTFFSGALMGNVITFVHMGSAAVAVGVAYMVFSTGMGGFAQASRALQPASYALLVIMGCFLFFKALRDLVRGGFISDCHCSPEHEEVSQAVHIRKVLVVSFITGLVPCPGAAIILAFAIGQGIFWAGMGAILSMAVGMGLTTTLFAWAAVAARGVTLKASGANRVLFNWMHAILSICGAAAIALFGAVLFLNSNVWH